MKLRYVSAALAMVSACSASTDPGESPLVDLANRLYLQGEWAWTDSTGYENYLPIGDSVPHRGWYVVTGTATIEAIDSASGESYAVTATARIDHVDSNVYGETANWFQDAISYVDTAVVRNDSVIGLFVAPIPPESNANTDLIAWEFSANELWCTNWLDRPDPGSPYNTACSTRVRWTRTARAGTGT